MQPLYQTILTWLYSNIGTQLIMHSSLFHNFRLIRLIVQNRIYKKSSTWPMIELAYLSATLTIEQKCFQYFCEAVVES